MPFFQGYYNLYQMRSLYKGGYIMKSRNIALTLIFVMVVASGLQCAIRKVVRDEPESQGSDPKITLKVKYPPGKYEMVQEQNVNFKAEIEAGEMTLPLDGDQKNIMVNIINVSKPDENGNTIVNIHTKRIRDETSRPVWKVVDTDNPASLPTGPQGKMLNSLLKADLAIRFDRNWNVLSVTGMEEMWDQLVASDPASAPIVSEMKKQMGGEAMARIVSESMKLAPDKPVGIGGIWYSEMEMPFPIVGNMKCESKCKLISLENTNQGQIATIKVFGVFTSEDAKGMNIGPAFMEVNSIEFELNGYEKVNVDTGLKFEESHDIKGKFLMTVGSGMQTVEAKLTMSGSLKKTIKPIK